MLVPFFGFEVEPLGAQSLFNIGPLAITNTILTGILAAVLVVLVLGFAARASQLWPKSKLAFYVESLIEAALDLITELFGDRKMARRFFPLLITLFIFILISNFTGLLPGIGSLTYHNESLFRAWTTDLNSTAALAVLTMVIVQVHAVRTIGAKGYFQHFFTHQPWKPLNLFVGFLDVFGEIMRLVTLALRLFGVIYGGEALLFAIAAVAGNFGWATMLPIMFLEIFFCFVQAYLFMMLSASYLVMSTSMHDKEETEETLNTVAEAAKA
ncbi:F0F1 ATP synthase subunit A [Candidatus Saccharibacteria bacterium]|nr:F0F1 ATP synthase subunit A [Candidatus Saccharibacteria bacterium]